MRRHRHRRYAAEEDRPQDPWDLLAELRADGAVTRIYGYGANGLVSRYLTDSSTLYYVYSFDPDGNLVQRHPKSIDGIPGSTSVFDLCGILHADVSKTGANYGVSDPFGYGAQFGLYTDLETRPSPTSTGLAFSGDYYDPVNARYLARSGGDLSPYVTGNPWAHALGSVLSYGLGERFGGPIGGAATLGAWEGVYAYAEGHSAEDSALVGAEAGVTAFATGKVLGFLGRTRAGQAISGWAKRGLGRIGAALGGGRAAGAARAEGATGGGVGRSVQRGAVAFTRMPRWQALSDAKMGGNLGLYDRATGIISVNAEQSPSDVLQSLRHEWVHFAIGHSRIARPAHWFYDNVSRRPEEFLAEMYATPSPRLASALAMHPSYAR